MALSGVLPRTRSPVFAGTRIDLGHPMPPARPTDLAAVRGVQTQSLPGDPTIGFRPTPGIGRFQRREAPVAPAPMLITPEPVAAPRAPAAPSSAPGGLGGLGGFGDTLEAVGYSMMTGGHGNLFGNFPQAMEGIRARREAEAERARKEQAEMAERQALGAALVDSGVFPSMEAASRYMASPDGLRVMMEARERQREEAKREAMMDRARQMDPSLRGQPAQGQPPALGDFSAYEDGGAQVASQPGAPVGADVVASDPYADIQRLEDQIIQFESAAKAYEQVDPIMAAQRQAVANSLARRRDLLAERLPPVQGGTDDMREYEFARSQGYDGSFNDYQRDMRAAGATRVDARQAGPVPVGYRAVYDENNNLVQYEPVPGGPAAMELEAARRQQENSQASRNKYATIVDEDIGRAISQIDTARFPVTGLGSLASAIPGTPAHDLYQTLQTVRANVGFDRLQEMRANSPTGGALGSITEGERRALEATLGALEQSQSADQLKFNLDRLQRLTREIVHGPDAATPTPTPSDEGAPGSFRYNPATGELEPE